MTLDLNKWILANEISIRMGFFIGILTIMALWEFIAPRRALTVSKTVRWLNNLGIAFLNSFLLRLAFPTAAVGVALFAEHHGWGLLHYYQIPTGLAVFFAIVAMDLVIYIQHVLVHAIPILWRFHRLHHADLDYDLTTGARFHPIEIFLSMGIKFAAIIVLGTPVVAVILFEITLNLMAMFNHANVKLPLGVDRILRLLFVTPDMHRVHHSIEDDETNSNFGFNLSIWDRLMGTYRDQPRAGHKNMTLGIHTYRDAKDVSWLPGMLMLPFKGKISHYVINRRQWEKDKHDD